MESRRRIRASYKQLNLLVKFMCDNPNLARGVNYRTAFGKHYHDAKWTELANLLNAQENGMNKSPREWNRYWKDLKSGIKKKVKAMKKMPGRTKTLSRIEQVIYKNLCNIRNRKNTVVEEKNCSYLQIPADSDQEPEQYEVEYLEETSCDNISDMERVDNFDDGLVDSTLNGAKTELADRNVQALDLIDQDHFLIETIMNESSSAESRTDMAEEATVINNDVNVKNYDTNINISASTKNYNSTDVLTDIRNHLRELVAVQKERARSELRLASAHERRAILEEKRVRIEERRLKMEERRVVLEERKMEALEKRCFAQERLASAAERKNEITEHRMSNSDYMIT